MTTRRLLAAALLAAGSITGCLPGSGQNAAPPPVSAPSDEVFANLFRAVEERRADRFTSGVAPDCAPASDKLWNDLTAFFNVAELIEYNVTVERRVVSGNSVTYVFTWLRKYDERETGRTVTGAGKSEWTFTRTPGGPYLLTQAVGMPLF